MSRNRIVLLLSSAGRRAALLECFREDARRLGLELRVIATDLRPDLSAACQLADAAFAMPRCTEDEYVPLLTELCRRESVDLLVPTIDPELPVLAGLRERLAARGTLVAISTPEVVAVARNKRKTAELLDRAGVTVPRTLNLQEALAEPNRLQWPLILKPTEGSSSVGVRTVATPHEAEDLARNNEDYVAQERWVGREFTVNLYFEPAAGLVCTVPHWRIETRGGEVSKGQTERVPVLETMAERIAMALPGARGALCFQAIVNPEGQAAVFEINARFGGGFPLAHRAGARFSEWLLREASGLPSAANNDWRPGVTMLRYDSAVFRDA